MLGRRSLSFPLIPWDLQLECTLRQTRAEWNSNLLEEHYTETIGEGNHMALRGHCLPTMYTTPHASGYRLTMRLSLALYRVYLLS
jgi:hypothetical protein